MKRLRKRIISGIATFSVLLTMLPVSAFAANDNMLPEETESTSFVGVSQQGEADDGIQNQGQSGTDGPHILGETEVITYSVTGGNIYFNPETGMVTDCDFDVTAASIPSVINGVNVLGIDGWAFSGMTNLKSITISEGITSILNYAFQDCTSLEEVVLPKSLKLLGPSVFVDCENLKRVVIQSDMQMDGENFYGCDKLITAGPIGGGYNIEFSWNKSIPDNAFSSSELRTIVFPSEILKIGNKAFYECDSLENISLPNSITEIDDNAFYGCECEQVELKLPEELKVIGEYAFGAWSNNIKEIIIPDSVTFVGAGAFNSCASLEHMVIPSTVLCGGCIFRFCPKLNTAGPIGGDYDIEFGWTEEIPDYAFFGMGTVTVGKAYLESVVLPDSITRIGISAFEDCTEIESIEIPDGITEIGESAFRNCQSLKAIKIPSSLKTIDEYVFSDCNNLQNVTISDGVKNLEGMSFGFANFKSIFLPKSIERIAGAFELSDLTDIYYAGSKDDWNKIEIIYSLNDSLETATIHYNSTGPDDPGIDQPETSMGGVSFLSKWDSNTRQAYFDYSALAYSVTDNTEISPNQSIDQLVGKYVLVKTNESSPLEISSIKPVDSRIGTVTDVIVGNGNPAVTSLQFEDGTYAVVNGLIVSEGIIGKQVLYHLLSEEIVGYTELQKKTGTLENWDSDSGQLVIDGVTYFTNYMTNESPSTNIDQLIGKRVEILCQEGVIASYIFQIAEAKEDYHIQVYASTPNLSTNINGTIDIICSLYRDDKLVEDWVEPAFVIGNDKVISTSDYTLKDGSYYFTVTGLAEGRSSLTVSDSYSGAYITVDISVGKATSRAYSYRMDDIPSFVPNVYGESVLTNFYNVNDLYVNNFSYTKTSDGGYDVSFNVYNQGYMYGAVDVYDKDGKWIQSEKIDKFSDISSLWDTGEAIVYLIADSFDGRLLSYTSGVLSKETPVSVHVPKDGYLTISNNFSESPGAFLYNTVDYLMLSINTVVNASVDGVQTGLIAEDIVDRAIKDIDFQKEFMDQFNEIALNVSQTALEFGYGAAAEAITVDAEDLLDSVGLDWKSSAESVVGGLETVFSKITGPAGAVLKGCFAFTNFTSYVVQTNDICCSVNAPSILIHVPSSTSSTTTVQGVTVTTGAGAIDSEAVLQVFRIANTDAIVFIDGEIPVEEYKLYNICFIKNGEEVKPNGKVTVKIPIPSGYDKDECVVYRQEPDGKWVILQAYVEGNYLVFETDHFSLYAIAEANNSHVHIPGEAATCTKPQVCIICSAELAPATGHKTVKTEAKAATCTEDGNIECWYCEACGKYFSDEALTKEISKEDTLVKAEGHGETELKNEKEATCTVEGYTGDKVCKNCGEVLGKGEDVPKLMHSYKNGKCTVCGAIDSTYKPNEPGMTKDPADPTVPTESTVAENPKTGDDSNIALWILILVIGGCAVTGITAYNKRKSC